MRILLLYPDLPSETKAAGHKSAFKTIEELYLLGHELNLISFDSTGALESDLKQLRKFCKSIYVVKIDAKQKIYNCLRHPIYPSLVSSRISSEFLQLVENIVPDVDIIHIEFSQLLYYVKYLKIKYPGKKLFFYSHDVLLQRSHREVKKCLFLNPIKVKDYFTTLFVENRLLGYADKVVVFNDKDSDMLSFLKHRIGVIPLYAVGEPFELLQDKSKDCNVVYFGAMNRKENYLAATAFIKKAWPTIHNKYPYVKLLVIGANPHVSLLRYNHTDNIVVTGFVDNPYTLIASSLVSVAPIKLGAGLKVKVLESLLCGCPVVAFPAGSEGIGLDRSEGLITVLGYQELIKEVTSILSGEVCYEPSHVRNSVSRKFNWQNSIDFWKRYYQ